jgi:hypothetical protein
MISTKFGVLVFAHLVGQLSKVTDKKVGMAIKPIRCDEDSILIQLVKSNFIGGVVIMKHPKDSTKFFVTHCEETEHPTQMKVEDLAEMAADRLTMVSISGLVDYLNNLESGQKIIKRPHMEKYQYN